MKEKSSEELNEELREAIFDKKIDLIPGLVEQVGKDIDPNLVLYAIASNDTSIIKYISFSIGSKWGEFSSLYKNEMNPVEYVVQNYLSLKNNPNLQEPLIQEFLLDSLNKALDIFNVCGASVKADTVSVAISNCDKSVVNNLLNFKDLELNRVTGYILPPLNQCLWKNDLELFKKLIEKGANVNNNSIIMDAIRHDNGKGYVEVILKNEVNLDIEQHGQNPIMVALVSNKFDLAEMLIKSGAPLQERKLINFDYNNVKIFEFYIKHDFETKKLIEGISQIDVYDKFEEAKKSNDKGLVVYLLKNHTQDIYDAIKEHGTTKENINFFQKNAIRFEYKHGELIVASQLYSRDEAGGTENEVNHSKIQEESRTHIKEGNLYLTKNNKIINFEKEVQEDGVQNPIYVIDKKGNLYIQDEVRQVGNHTHFLKGMPEKEGLKNELYGYGKPIACGGHIHIKDGKIDYIDNGSGHYVPGVEQLKLVINHLNKKGVLAENIVIKDHTAKEYNLKTFLSEGLDIKVPELYKKDKKIENKPSFIKEQSDNEISRNSKEKEGQEVFSKERSKIKQLVEGIDIKRNFIDAPQQKTISSVKPSFIHTIINKAEKNSKDGNILGGK